MRRPPHATLPAVKLVTSRQIAETLARTPDQVRYVLGRFCVEPIARAAHVHLYSPAVIPMVEAQLRLMDRRSPNRDRLPKALPEPVPAA